MKEDFVVSSGLQEPKILLIKEEKPAVVQTNKPAVKKEEPKLSIKKDITYYLDAFKHLHCAVVNGKKAPHKALLLLSIMDLIEDKTIKDCKIELTDELVKRFMHNTLTLASNYSGKALNIGMPYFHMNSESFWELKDRANAFGKLSSNSYSVPGIRMAYEFAKVDDELFALMREKAARNTLRELLLVEYLGQTLSGVAIPEESEILMTKLVDKSVLYQGFTIPVAEHEKFYAHLNRPLNHGEQCKIKVWMDGTEYTCNLINQAFSQSTFVDHKDVVQIRWTENDPICQHIQKVFERSKRFIDGERATRTIGTKTVIRVPKAMQQFIEVYGTEKKLEFRFAGIQ